MDFGVLGFDGLVSLASPSPSTTSAAAGPETKQTLFGSGKDSNSEDDGCCRNSKLARTDKVVEQRNCCSSGSTTDLLLLKSNGQYLFSDSHHQPHKMLSFSSCPNKPEAENVNFPRFPLTSSSYPYGRNTEWNNRGPFTASQWVELEHQALIYKYISASMPIPSQLLLPIRKAFESTLLGGGLLRPTTWGWGTFHLGFSNGTDPEPGRCRRTDGKKWRCSRDAVPNHKYCERHMNRGRHRSRKPVEGHQQQLSSRSSATTTTASNPKLMVGTSAATYLSGAAAGSPSGGGGAALTLEQQQPDPTVNRTFLVEERQNLKPKGSPLFITEQQNRFHETSLNEFGLVSSDSLLNPSHKNKQSSFTNLADQETKSHHPLLQFFDSNWPRSNQSDGTQLSDFMSSTSSPNNDNILLSPLRLSSQRQANWVPISWDSPIGGPLGEVLHNGSECKNNTAGLNLLADGWDGRSCQSSPTGVLQKTAFGSVSNSSAGSSPRGVESRKAHEGGSFCNDLGSALMR